jgi:hypothetical protein
LQKFIVKPDINDYNEEKLRRSGGMKTEYVMMNQKVPMLRFSCELKVFDQLVS